jgi:hypothetical protein
MIRTASRKTCVAVLLAAAQALTSTPIAFISSLLFCAAGG